MEWPERPCGGFRTLYLDPAWTFETFSDAGQGKSASQHYPVMSLDEMKAWRVAELMAANSACFMWATFPCLPQALDLLAHYGFEYRTGGAWAKQSSTGQKLAFGTGYIFRGAAELLLVGVRGKPRWLSKSERNLWLSPIREHSRKPDEVRAMIERLAPGPRLELNARTQTPGWIVHGNEVGKFPTPADVGDVL